MFPEQSHPEEVAAGFVEKIEQLNRVAEIYTNNFVSSHRDEIGAINEPDTCKNIRFLLKVSSTLVLALKLAELKPIEEVVGGHRCFHRCILS